MSSIKHLLKNSTDVNYLREASLLILESNERQAKVIKELQALRSASEAQQAWQDEELRRRLKCLNRSQFKRGRESTGERSRKHQDDEVLLHAQSLCGEKQKLERWQVPSEELVHEAEVSTIFSLAQMRDSNLDKNFCEISPIDKFSETSTEVTIIERSFKKIIHKRQKYKVLNTQTSKELIVTAPGPMRLFPQCRYSLDFAVHVASDKYLDHLPYERQRRRMVRKGLDISVRTLSRLTEMVSLHCEGVAELILKDVLSAPLAAHLDETPWPIQSSKDSNGYMWVVSNQAGSYFRFEPTRSGDVPKEILKGHNGSVLTDGYKGYLFLRSKTGVNWGCCWAHLRRKFFLLKEDFPEDSGEILSFIDDLFLIERKAKNWDELKSLRKLESSKLVSKIEGWLISKRSEYFPESGMREAISYGLNYWGEFKTFLSDMTLPLSNNDAERAIRHSVLGRKNFHGSKTINGADTASTLYTIIESSKKAELDPITYIKYVITENNSDRVPLTPLEFSKQQALK